MLSRFFSSGVVVFAFLACVPAMAQDVEVIEPRMERDNLPDGMVARLGFRPFLHGNPIGHMRFTSDGKNLITGGSENVIRIWSVPEGKVLREIPVGRPRVNVVRAMELSPNGKTLAVSAGEVEFGGTMHVIDVASGKVLHRFGDRNTYPVAIALSDDGKKLFTLEGQGAAKWWNLATGKVEETKEHGGKMFRSLLAPDQKSLLHANINDAEPALTSLESGKQLAKIAVDPRNVTYTGFAAFSKDGSRLAIVRKDAKVAFLNTVTGETIGTFALPVPKNIFATMRSVAFAPDGKSVAVGDGEALSMYTVDGKKLQDFPFQPSGVHHVAISPDGKILASAGNDHVVRLWDATTGKRLGDGPNGFVFFAALSADGRTVYAHHHDRTLRGWDVATGESKAKMARSTPFPAMMNPSLHAPSNGGRVWISQDEKTLATPYSVERLIDIWDPRRDKQLRSISAAHGNTGIGVFALSPKGDLVAHSLGQDVAATNLATGTEAFKLQPPPARPDARATFHTWQAFQFSHDSHFFAAASYSRVLVWDLDTRKVLHDIEHKGFSRGETLAFSPGDRVLAFATSDDVILYEIATGKERLRIPTKSTSHLAFTPDGLGLVVGSESGEVKLLSVLHGEAIHSWPKHTFTKSVNVSADGTRMLSFGWEGVACVWKMPAASHLVKDVRVTEYRPRQAWGDLADENAGKAFLAFRWLAANPQEAIKLLKQEMKPVEGVDVDRVNRLIGQLNDEKDEVQKLATKELTALGAKIGPYLREALRDPPSNEARTRIENLLAKVAHPSLLSPRTWRALELLEAIGGNEGSEVLGALAEGDPISEQTVFARQALFRISKRK